MAKLSTLFVPAALAALAFTAAPAMASSAVHQGSYSSARYVTHGVNHGQAASLQRDITRLGTRIDRSLDRRVISRREANNLRVNVRNLQRQFTQAQRGGLSRAEARTIEVRIAQVNRALKAERRDGNGRRS